MMVYSTIDVNIITHAKAFEAGVDAMGLWMWGMCFAQLHATDGHLPRAAVLAAWGGKRNIMLATKLVAAGLWSVNEDGSWSIWNYEKKNQRAEEIERKRAAAKDRYNRWKLRQFGTEQTRLQRVGNEQTNAFANAQQHVATELSLTGTGSLTGTEREGPPSAPPPPIPPEPVTKTRRTRKARLPEPERTSCPLEGSSPEAIAEWCAKWGIPPEHKTLRKFLGWHWDNPKKNSRVNWKRTWDDWLDRDAQYMPASQRSPVVQSAENRAWKMPEGFE